MHPTNTKSLLLAVGLAVLMVLAAAYLWPIQEDYHPLNTDWNGCSRVANIANERSLITQPSSSPPEEAVLFVIGPSQAFNGEEGSRLRSFLERGGSIVLADDFGEGNSLLEQLNVSLRISKKPIADFYSFSKNPSFPLITNFSKDNLTVNVTAVLLERPTYLETANATSIKVLAFSSLFAFETSNATNQPSPNEPFRSYPVIAITRIGQGHLVVISDASLFTNEMIELYGNARLFRNLVALGNGKVSFDVSHLNNAPLTNWRIGVKNFVDGGNSGIRSKDNGIYQALIVTILILATFTFERCRSKRGRSRHEVTSNLYTHALC